MDQPEFLEKLFTFLSHSAIAYKEYLAGGKTFQYAQELKIQNRKALQLLTENKSSVPANLYPEIEALITHYTVWTEKWETLAAEINPGPDDQFIFANEISFPRNAVEKLEAEYKSLNLPSVTPHKK